MKHLRIPLMALFAMAMTWVSANSIKAVSLSGGQSTALERGYRTGYSDGYNAGYKDIADNSARDYQSKDEYQRADRSYSDVWGPREDYRDGYQQGYESGYTAGYDRQPFNSSIPTGLGRRGIADRPATSQDTAQDTTPDTVNPSNDTVGNTSPAPVPSTAGPIVIPSRSVLTIELESSLSTDVSQKGDPFQARVISPNEYQGAIIEGRVTRVKRPGKVSGVAEIQLAFEQIRMPDGRVSVLKAEVVEVIDTGNQNGGEVDPEGGVRGKDSTKDDVSKVGAAAGIGALIGAIAGGGRGAAIGAAIGGAASTGGVLTRRGKDVRLDRGQQLRIRTAVDVHIQ